MLSESDKQTIKKLYLENHKTVKEIMQIINNKNVTESMIRHFIQRNNLNRYSISKPLTKEQKEIIIHMNNNNKTCSEIERVLNVDRKRINAFLHTVGLNSSLSIYKRVSEEQIKDICSMYKAGSTAKEILQKYSDIIKCENTIIKIIKDSGENVRPCGRAPYMIDEHFFEKIDTEEKAYFLGWLITDGYVVKAPKKSYVIGLDVNFNDRYILEKFQEAIGLSKEFRILNQKKKASDKRNRDTYQSRIVFSSNKIASDLNNYGIVPRKSKTIKFPEKIPNLLMPHFIRGVFDGDGCISNGSVSFYGNFEFISEVQNFLVKTLNINRNKIFHNKCCNFFTFSSKKDVKNFYHYIYDNATIFLKRKRTKFENLNFIKCQI